MSYIRSNKKLMSIKVTWYILCAKSSIICIYYFEPYYAERSETNLQSPSALLTIFYAGKVNVYHVSADKVVERSCTRLILFFSRFRYVAFESLKYQICRDFFLYFCKERLRLRYCCVVGAVQAKAIMMVASRISGTPSSTPSTPSTPITPHRQPSSAARNLLRR
jgi:hypothetical protein